MRTSALIEFNQTKWFALFTSTHHDGKLLQGWKWYITPTQISAWSHVFGYFYEYFLKSIILLVLRYAFHHVTYLVTFHNWVLSTIWINSYTFHMQFCSQLGDPVTNRPMKLLTYGQNKTKTCRVGEVTMTTEQNRAGVRNNLYWRVEETESSLTKRLLLIMH